MGRFISLSPLSAVHSAVPVLCHHRQLKFRLPARSMAWGLLSMIPQTLLKQVYSFHSYREVIYCLRDCTTLSGHEPPHFILYLFSRRSNPNARIISSPRFKLFTIYLSSCYPSFKTALGKGTIRDDKRLRTAQRLPYTF